jgi:hypothetical protein
MILDPPDFRTLAYLHDAICFQIVWDCTNPNSRKLRLKVKVHEDAGYAPWNGKELELTLSDALALEFEAWGFCVGFETIDSWREGVSDALRHECKGLESMGIRLPSNFFTIAFHSGSILEVICSEVSILGGENEDK